MQTKLLTGVALATLMIPGAAFAQSTGTVDIENQEVVVTGHRDRSIGGFQQADTPKTRGVLTQQFIAHQVPGQSVDELINQLPGVSFQNNDPYGAAGGTLTIRGFDSSRISQTIDGIPLNDTGNYAIYSNQQLDPELIEQVTVNLGSTDIDSPTASATGSTVNYRTVRPTDAPGARFVGSVGDYHMFRVFGQLNTGVFTKFGTKMWVAASHQNYDWFVNDFGKINKAQYNGELYQPLGSNGDFLSISGNYNVNRNNFGGSIPFRRDATVLSVSGTAPNQVVNGATRTVGTGTSNRFPTGFDELPYHIARCTTPAPVKGTAQTSSTTQPTDANAAGNPACGTTYDERYNPSNTGSIRINSRFTLADGLVLTVDPSFQYTRANGGGTTAPFGLYENGATLTNSSGYTRPAGYTTGPFYGSIAPGPNTGSGQTGTNYYGGFDVNGDGDLLDTVTALSPSQTVTHRYGVIASLRYDLSDTQSIRVGYTHDYGRHRQTGELGYLQINGQPQDVFPLNDPIRDVLGNVIQKRNRLSFAILDQGDIEYTGRFFDDAVLIDAGLTGKFFKRRLNNYCFTSSATGTADCVDPTQIAAFGAANPYLYVAPGATAVLPNGATVPVRNATTGVIANTALAAGASYTNPSTTTPVILGFAPPQFRRYVFNRALPSLGATVRLTPKLSVHANYDKAIQVPGTDNLYNAFYYPQASTQAQPKPETTDNFDAGLRYSSPQITAEINPWYTRFHNRLASSYDPDTQSTFYRNLGEVEKYGIDTQLDYRPIPQLLIHTFGSYLKSRILNNLVLGNCPTGTGAVAAGIITCQGTNNIALTAGKRESGAPTYEYGGRIQGDLGPVELGLQAKRTGRRYVNDQNTPQYQSYTQNGVINYYQVSGAFAPGYWQVDADARLSLAWAGLNDKTYLQFNVQNLTNQFFVGGFTGGQTSNTASPTFAQVGYPRTFSASLNVQF